MSNFRGSSPAFVINANPLNPKKCISSDTRSFSTKRPRRFHVRREAPNKPFIKTVFSSAARGAPISGVTMPIAEEEVTSLSSTDGYELGAYFVRPEDTAAVEGRGVILMTDILGFKNEDTRSVARRFAEAGLPVVVPDLFRGVPWTQGRSMTEYEEWRLQHEPTRVRQDAKVWRDFLAQQGYATRLGMVGFCFGGGRVMEEIALPSEGLNPKVAVAFYPTRFDPEDVGRKATCSLLFISGDEDELVPMSVVEKLQETINEENDDMEDCEMQIVEGAGHAFAHHPKSEQNEVDGEIVLSRAVAYLLSKL